MLDRRTVRARRLGQAGVAVVLAGIVSQAAYAGDPGDFLIDSVKEGSSNGVVYRSATFPGVGAGGTAFAVAKCPKGKTLTGGGAHTSGVVQDARFIELGPNRIEAIPAKPRKSYTAQLENTSASPLDATSYAICAGKRGTSMKTKSAPEPDNNAVVNVKATCPRGTAVTGGGLTSDSNSEFILTSAPFDGGDIDSKPEDGWEATIVTGLGQPDRQLRAHAFCSDTFKLVYRRDTETNMTVDGFAQAECPSKTAVTGGGMSISGGAGAFLNTSSPVDVGDVGEAPDNGWEGRAGVTTGTRSLDVYAICRK